MGDGPIVLGWGAIAGASALVLINGALSLGLRLGIERTLVIASVRTVVQLTLMGYILLPVFEMGHPALVAGVALVMVIAAARAAMARVSRRYDHARWHAFAALLLSSGVTVVAGTRLIVGVQPWWEARYLLPLLGMILGNSLTGISLGVESCLERMVVGRTGVEALLVAGATRWEASRPVVRHALRTAMVPIINSMSVVGLVSIPGMMTGQLLSGTAPEIAARYQILIMFLIAAATALGAAVAVLLAARACFDDRTRLRPERITANDSTR